MKTTLNVPSIACEVCAKTITNAIRNLDSQAQVNIDVANKIVDVESQKSETEIKEVIIDAGHEISN